VVPTAGDAAVLALRGPWLLRQHLPNTSELIRQLDSLPKIRSLAFDSSALSDWDTALLIGLRRVCDYAGKRGIAIDAGGLPDGARRLLQLAQSASAAHVPAATPGWLARLGAHVIATLQGAPDMLNFLGELVVALGRFLRGRAQFRGTDLWLTIQETGPHALPIVSLISFLVGLILAYMGAMQLALFGAQIYIADLVGIGMVREIGALMTGVIIAGRAGAAFAAQIGTMQVNDELDALRVLGISPVDFLVVPRVTALVLMMPLLTLYAGVVGIFAGMVVAWSVFNVGVFEYYYEVVRALDLRHFAVGIAKGTTYGALVAYAGCLRGMQCGRDAQAVGEATTSAVVTGILLIVVSASILTILFQELGI
jgi:phospholipid/cholesterol/gamma-HCH transport system permease protein